MLLLSRFIIQGHSMEPNILQGQTILVSSIPYLFFKPKIGDIVVIKNNKYLVKRIARIDPSADGERYFVSGDNKKDSMDSRKLGWISREDIVGKVIYTINF